MKNKLIMRREIIIFCLVFCYSCELPNHKSSDEEPGFGKLNCENISETKILKYPKILDSLIQRKIIKLYSKDSLVDYEILGSVQYLLNLENCEIDKSTYLAVINVESFNKKELWKFEFKKINEKIELINTMKLN